MLEIVSVQLVGMVMTGAAVKGEVDGVGAGTGEVDDTPVPAACIN